MKLYYTIVITLFVAVFGSLIGAGLYAGYRAELGRAYEKQQPVMVTDQGIFVCRYTHVGRSILSDYKCGRYVLVSPLPANVTPTMQLPVGTKTIDLE